MASAGTAIAAVVALFACAVSLASSAETTKDDYRVRIPITKTLGTRTFGVVPVRAYHLDGEFHIYFKGFRITVPPGRYLLDASVEVECGGRPIYEPRAFTTRLANRTKRARTFRIRALRNVLNPDDFTYRGCPGDPEYVELTIGFDLWRGPRDPDSLLAWAAGGRVLRFPR